MDKSRGIDARRTVPTLLLVAVVVGACGGSGVDRPTGASAGAATTTVARVSASAPATAAASQGSSPSAVPTPAFDVAHGDILFNNDDGEIYAIADDGSNRRRLTTAHGTDWMPVLSPDGRTIAFGSDRAGMQDIYVMSADGTGKEQRLTGNEFNSYHPSWSPDGRRIVFGAYDTQELYIVDADGHNQTLFTAGGDSHPEWAPSGTTIAFSRLQGDHNAVFLTEADGSGVRELTHGTQFDLVPSWSPDGTRIAFVRSAAFDSDGDIYTMTADGHDLVQLTKGVLASWPTWSPDGRRIAYNQKQSPTSVDIWVMNADGSNATQLTTTGHDWGPRWR